MLESLLFHQEPTNLVKSIWKIYTGRKHRIVLLGLTARANLQTFCSPKNYKRDWMLLETRTLLLFRCILVTSTQSWVDITSVQRSTKHLRLHFLRVYHKELQLQF